MPEFLKGCAKGCRLFGVMEKGAKFRFGGGGEDHFDNGREMEDGDIEDVGIRFVAKEEMSALSAPRPYGIEVRGVAVNFEDHVTGVIADGAGGVAGAVVKKLEACVFCNGGSSCLSRGELTQGSEDGGVNSTTVK